MNKKKKTGVYPGSFDPITLGHLDIIERASRMVDRLVVGVLINSSKSAMFTLEERVAFIKKATAHLPNVEVVSFNGLLVDFMKEQKADINFRGLRSAQDFDSELPMAQANHAVYPEMETVFLGTSPEYAFISSTLVKDLIRYNGDFSLFVPADVSESINQIRRNQ